jgi:hypothetical protein
MKAKLLIVTDLGLLKAYQVELPRKGSPQMKLVEELVLEPAHQHVAEQITDSAGRRAATASGTGGGTMADSHNLHLETRRRLIRELAHSVSTLAASHPDGCWLAAAREILHPIVAALPQALRGRIERQVPRDLTKLAPREVLSHFLPAAEAPASQ